MSEEVHEASEDQQATRSDAWTDLALTLPVFVLYHLGVAFLPVRNAADPLTGELQSLAHESIATYAALTFALGAAFVLALALLGRKKAFAPQRFLFLAAEGVAYAVLMRFVGGWALEALPLEATSDGASSLADGPFGSVVMALGAGFYEELTFRVCLFGAGAWIVKTMEGRGPTAIVLLTGWALVEALAFSAWHHVGPMADAFDMRVFAYRAVCGLVLTTIYAFRGFAPAVWTHAVYDVWAMV
jgi:hypothetical protein